MCVTVTATMEKKHNSSSSSLPSQSNHSQRSSTSFGSLSCITVRKYDPTAKAGIKLQQDSEGQVTVTNIASNGLFASTDLEVGDIVLAVNKKRLSHGEGPEVLMNIVHKYSTISIAVKKKQPPVESPLKHNRKNKKKQQNRLSILSGSSHHHKLKPRRHQPGGNNIFQIDTHYGGMAQHNADGSLRIQLKSDDSKKNKTLPTKSLTISASKPHSSSDNNCVGLELDVVGKQLVVKSISYKSIFRSTNLRLGDVILSINDMSFRKFADAEYAITIMNKSLLMVTLVVERLIDDCDDTATGEGDEDDDDSLSSFGNYDDEEETVNYEADASQAFNCSFGSTGEVIETDFKVEKYRPVTISVPKSFKSQNAGLVFKTVRTKTQGLYNPTISHMHPDAPAHPQWSPPSVKKTTWVYVDSIRNDSIFKNTSLRRGDKVVSINNINLKENPDPRAAYQACYDSKEAIAMVVRKDDQSIYKEKDFEFDRSSSDLDWKA